jgi:6-phosphogluconolactonase
MVDDLSILMIREEIASGRSQGFGRHFTTRGLPMFRCLSMSLAICLVMMTSSTFLHGDEPNRLLAFFGSYSKPGSAGVSVYEFDLSTGKFQPLAADASIRNPSFLAVHPTGRFLYAVSEVDSVNGQPGGGVASYAIDRESGKITLLNQQSSGGGGPCYVSIDSTGQCALVANYGGGSVACLPIAEDGQLQKATAVIPHQASVAEGQKQPRALAHSILPSPDNRFALSADKGCDEVFIYKLDAAAGKLAPNDPAFAKLKPGAGPRHVDFHPSGRFVYVINEIDSTVTGFQYDAQTGRLTTIDTLSTLPEGFEGSNSTAQIRVHPSGKFVYGSNRGYDSIAIFSVDEESGRLTAVGHVSTQGKTPRNFNIDPTGQYLIACNMATDNVVTFKIDSGTGKLTQVGEPLKLVAPVCVQFLER